MFLFLVSVIDVCVARLCSVFCELCRLFELVCANAFDVIVLVCVVVCEGVRVGVCVGVAPCVSSLCRCSVYLFLCLVSVLVFCDLVADCEGVSGRCLCCRPRLSCRLC